MADPNLQMFRSDTPTVEIGTVGNPIDFGFCPAGETTQLSYDIILWNDKAAALGSNDAYDIYVELLQLTATESWVSDGSPSQVFNSTYSPVVSGSEELLVNGEEWVRVDSLIGWAQKKVFLLDYETGEVTFGDNVNGAIPPSSASIAMTYTPDTNVFGKLVFTDQWITFQSSGVVENDVHVDIELSTKIDNDTIEVLHYPKLSDVTGVWDNISKTGTNYYTGGSFSADTGRITLGTPLTGVNPYVEYDYCIKDDNEAEGTALGNGDDPHGPLYRIPQNNAKRIQLAVTVPATADTEGGVYIKTVLRFLYKT